MATSLTISFLADIKQAVAGIDTVEKRTRTMGEKMQGVAMAIGGAFGTQKIVSTVEGWVNAGLAARGAMKNVVMVFGEAGAGVNAWAEENAKSFGMTAADAEKGAAKIGVALEGMGVSHKEAAAMAMALMQRTADVAKVTGTDQETVLAKVETAFRGRTAGLKDYGVEVAKGADKTQIFNSFMQDTAQYAGRADTPLGNLHATMGDLSAELGMALVPIISTFLPLFQSIADFAKRNKVAFDIIVIALAAVALAFSVATVAAGAFGVTTWAGLWPILAVVAGIIALIAIIAVVIRYWHNIVEALKIAWQWISNVGQKFWWLIMFMGPLGVLIVVLTNFKRIWAEIEPVVMAVVRAVEKVISVAGNIATGAIDAFKRAWHGVEDAVNAVWHAIQKVIDIAKNAADKVGDVLSKIPLLNKIPGIGGSSAASAGVSTYGTATPYGVTFAPSITITGDVGDPVLAGRRIVNALEAWTQANGRRRIASLVAP